MFKSFKYRIYPTESQKISLAKHFGANRLVWNSFLEKHNKEYSNNKKYDTYYNKANYLRAMKQGEYSFLNEINSQSLQQTLMHLDKAFKNFFRNKKQFHYPNFKSKKNKQSITIPQHIKVNYNSGITGLCKLGKIPTRFHRTLEGKIKSCTISMTASGNYYISVLCEIDKPETQAKPISKETILGIDMGLTDFAVMSNGLKIPNPKFLKLQTKRLKHFQRLFSSKKKGSINRTKHRIKVSKLYERVNNQRSDFLHKLSHYIVSDNQVNAIVTEDLAVKNMVRNHNLARSILDSSWSEFIWQLEYKSGWLDKTFLKADRFYPSSKMCSNCGYINHDLELSDREWICPVCGQKHDRDFNATFNLRDFGIDRFVPGARREQVKQSPAEPLASTGISSEKFSASQSCEAGNRRHSVSVSTCPAS